MSQFDAADTVAFVTGANRGIGRSFVEALCEAGVPRVYAAARRKDTLAPLTDQFGDRVSAVELDLTKAAQIAAAGAADDVNLLINNAGILFTGSGLEDDAIENARTEMEVNYFGLLGMTRVFAPILQANGGGTVVNIGSIASQVSFPMINTYAASKAAMWSLSRGLRHALADQGTRLVTVHPGPIDTDMISDFDFDAAPPSAVAQALLDGLADGSEEIFPDAMAQDLYRQWLEDPKAVDMAAASMEV